MKTSRFIKFLDLFKALFEKMGVDYTALRSILNVKLVLDSRRTATVLQNTNNKKPEKNNFLSSLLFYLILGLVMIPLVIIGDSYLFQMTSVFGLFMFFMMTSLISDFSSVLLDLRDKDIILSRPISKKTLSVAKFIHISYYIFMTSLALVGPALLVSLFRKGALFFGVFLFEIILIDLFLIVVTGLLYLLILRFFDGEKLKDMINYVQIGLTISITVGYQLVARLFNVINFDNIEFQDKIWTYFFPPLWFSAPFEFIFNNSRESYVIIYSILALIVPVVAIVIYIKTIPIFESNLQKLNDASGSKKNKGGITNFVSKIVTSTKEERNFYIFSTNMMKNERKFKLKVYPGLGFGIIFPFLMIFPMILDSTLMEIRSSNLYFSIYFIGFIILAISQFLGYSGNYKGAFVYKISPIKDTTSIYRGALKAGFINLFTPVFILESIIFIFLFGFRILPDILLVYLNTAISIVLIYRILNKDLPFSRDFEMVRKGKIREMFFSSSILLVFAGLHFLASRIPFGIPINIVISIILNFIVWKYGFKDEILAVEG